MFLTQSGGSTSGTAFDTGRDRDRDIRYAFARLTGTYEQAFRLVHDQYIARGYMCPDPSGWRVSLYHALPTTKVFVAQERRDVIGTLALITDSPLGLPMDDLYRPELAPLRAEGRYVAEVSSLAISAGLQASGVAILKTLVRHLLLYAIEVGRCDDICIAVNPRHVAFYRKVFPDSHEIGERRPYDKVNGAPAVALRIDLRPLRARANAPRDTGPYEFVFKPETYRATVEYLNREAPSACWTPKQFRYFFSAHPALAEASAPALAHLERLYPLLDIRSVIAAYRSTKQTSEPTPRTLANAWLPALGR